MQIKPYAKSLSSVSRNRGLATLVTVTLVTTATLSFNLTAEAAILNDIDGSRNKAAILYLADKGVLAGYPDQTFKPNNVVNRAELLKILVASLGVTDLSGRNCFPDVTDQWFAPYVCYAKNQGWVSGYADGTFRPSEPVNKVEAIKMLSIASGNLQTAGNGTVRVGGYKWSCNVHPYATNQVFSQIFRRKSIQSRAWLCELRAAV